MRKGYYAQILFSKSGNMVGFATGSDACSEHEGGMSYVLGSLSAVNDNENAIVDALKKGKTVISPLEVDAKEKAGFVDKVVAALTPSALVYPDLLESRRVTKNLDKLQFVETEKNGEPEAWFGFARQPLPEYERELDFSTFSSTADKNVAGAWDNKSFALRVRGTKYVKALRGFYEATLAGDVAFAGRFLTKRQGFHSLGGVILANTKFISDDDRANIRRVQAQSESAMRLKARDDVAELRREMQSLQSGDQYIGYLWVDWKDEQESEVIYRLNPGHNVKAEHYSPYTRQQLLDWARANYSYHLKSYRDIEAQSS